MSITLAEAIHVLEEIRDLNEQVIKDTLHPQIAAKVITKLINNFIDKQ